MTRNDVKNLKKYQGYPSITILVPTYRTIPEKLKDKINVKNAISKSIDILLNNFDKKEIMPFAEKLDELVSKIDFSKTLDALAFFVNKDISLVYYLPFKVEEKVTVDKFFDVRDLEIALNKAQFFWVLALSKKPTRLFKSNFEYIEEIIDPESFPYQRDYDVTSDKTLYGYGIGNLDSKYITDEGKQFMIEVDDLLNKYISKEKWPIILLGTEKDRNYFYQASKHKDDIIGQVEGDFCNASIIDIEKEAKKVIENYFKLKQEEALKLLDTAIGELKFCSGIKETWHQALQGRIRILLVEENYTIFGSVNKENPENIILYDHQIKSSESDLVNELIDQVILHDGKVVFLDDDKLKNYDHVAAILRY